MGAKENSSSAFQLKIFSIQVIHTSTHVGICISLVGFVFQRKFHLIENVMRHLSRFADKMTYRDFPRGDLLARAMLQRCPLEIHPAINKLNLSAFRMSRTDAMVLFILLYCERVNLLGQTRSGRLQYCIILLCVICYDFITAFILFIYLFIYSIHQHNINLNNNVTVWQSVQILCR